MLLPLLASLALNPPIVGPPPSMAATGDSITRGFDSSALGDQPANSWATGTNAQVDSYLMRVNVLLSPDAGIAFNDARSGATMTELVGQAADAGSQGVALVTVLMGANDACTSSVSTMTDVATFQAQAQAALSEISTRLPDARIYVLSIPDVFHLWELFHTDPTAVFTWNTARICQSMLANATSMDAGDVDRRAQVRQRIIDFNTALANVCAGFIHCRFDQNAVFNTQFATNEVSTLDYFHPSVAGQAHLAAGAWDAGFDYTDLVAPTTQPSYAPNGPNTDVTLTATDDVGVSGIEYRTDGGWIRYASTLTLAPTASIIYRAVDVNGNIEGAVLLTIAADGGASFSDGGTSDAGAPSDAGAITDAGAAADSGVAMDAGAGSDGGGTNDGGSGTDAGVTPDGGGADAGGVDNTGTPGGTASPGCGCNAGPGGIALLALFGFLRRRRSRQVSSDT